MTKINLRLIFGAFLIIVGVILLLENLGLFELGSLVWTGILTVLASCFVVIYFRNHRLWWVWIPAVTLLSFAVQFALQDLAPAFERQYGEAIVLAGVALSFLTAYGFSTIKLVGSYSRGYISDVKCSKSDGKKELYP
jgi:hypothetical protein